MIDSIDNGICKYKLVVSFGLQGVDLSFNRCNFNARKKNKILMKKIGNIYFQAYHDRFYSIVEYELFRHFVSAKFLNDNQENEILRKNN